MKIGSTSRRYVAWYAVAGSCALVAAGLVFWEEFESVPKAVKLTAIKPTTIPATERRVILFAMNVLMFFCWARTDFVFCV